MLYERPIEQLQAAKELLTSKGWCQGEYTKDGSITLVRAMGEVCKGELKPVMHLGKPVYAVMQNGEQMQLFNRPNSILNAQKSFLILCDLAGTSDLNEYNDRKDTTIEKILSIIDQAIQKVGAK